MSLYYRPNTPTQTFYGMMTSSKKMLDFFELVTRVARTDSAILIRGETGTGKELVASAIHQLSPRKAHPFHGVNCAMLSPDLAASELFGHVRGAFTGAAADHRGFFESSHRGSLFLDEIAELPLSVQSRLLRAIQEKSFHKVGSTKSQKVDVRILSATHRALRSEVKRGRFREDLMYRIRVVPIFLPRLTERGYDIEILAWHFIDEFNKLGIRAIKAIDGRVRDALLTHSWPGNVRELRNNIEYAFAVGEGDVLTINELFPELRGESPPDDLGEADIVDYRRQERQELLKALHKSRGRKAEAAAALGMSRSTFWRKLKEFGIS